MTVQELIDKLEDLKKEFGNMEVYIQDPTYEGPGHVTRMNISGGEEIDLYHGNWKYKALRVDIWD